jgi:hypothetical protein
MGNMQCNVEFGYRLTLFLVEINTGLVEAKY